MMAYTFNVGGGAPISNFWSLLSDSNLDVNAAAGATGLLIENKLDNKLGLALTTVPLPTGAFIYIDGAEESYNGTIYDGADSYPIMKRVSPAAITYVKAGNAEVSIIIENGAGVLQTNYRYNGNGFICNGGTGDVFSIDKGGNILTSNAIPPAGVATVVKELPVYDMAGALLGYIEIKT